MRKSILKWWEEKMDVAHDLCGLCQITSNFGTEFLPWMPWIGEVGRIDGGKCPPHRFCHTQTAHQPAKKSPHRINNHNLFTLSSVRAPLSRTPPFLRPPPANLGLFCPVSQSLPTAMPVCHHISYLHAALKRSPLATTKPRLITSLEIKPMKKKYNV